MMEVSVQIVFANFSCLGSPYIDTGEVEMLHVFEKHLRYPWE